jgi:hypothetical protein
VLDEQRGDGGLELAGLAEPGEDVAFLQALVESLDEVVDDQRGVVRLGSGQPLAGSTARRPGRRGRAVAC